MERLTDTEYILGKFWAQYMVAMALILGGCSGTKVMRFGDMAKPTVSQGQLVIEDSIRIQLRGVSLPDPFYLSAVEDRDIREEVRVIAHEWEASVIRVPIYPVFWQRVDQYLRKYVDPILEEAQKAGVYVILAWQAQGSPSGSNTYTPAWAQADIWGSQPVNPDPDLAASALDRIARRYQAAPHVMYSIFSEPARVSWEAWRPVAERLVSVVREHDPDAVTLVPGVKWGSDLSGAISRPIRRSNIVYEAHAYPHHGDNWIRVAESLQSCSPVLIGEFGFLKEHVAKRFDLESYGQQIIRKAEQGDIAGWIAWVWHSSWQPSLLTSFTPRRPTSYGQFVKAALTKDSDTIR